VLAQGLGPRLFRTFGQKLNYFYAYALLQQLYKVLSGRPLGVLMNLVIGCLGDVCCIFLVVPLELMSMQQSEGEGLGTMFRKIYSTSGIAGFYQVRFLGTEVYLPLLLFRQLREACLLPSPVARNCLIRVVHLNVCTGVDCVLIRQCDAGNPIHGV
jgi:hypothetical protein